MVLSCLLLVAARAHGAESNLDLDQALAVLAEQRVAGAFSLSPSGELLAYEASAMDHGGAADIVLRALGTGKETTVFERATWPIFSPDGESLAALIRDGDAYRPAFYELSSGNTLRFDEVDALCRGVSRMFRGVWSADSRWFLFPGVAAGSAGVEANAEHGTPLVKEKYANLPQWASNAKAGTAKLAAYNKIYGPQQPYLFDRQSKRVAPVALTAPAGVALKMVGFDAGGATAIVGWRAVYADHRRQVYSDFYKLDVTGKSPPALLATKRLVSVDVSLSPDGRRLAYLTSGPLATNDVEVVFLDNGETRVITRDVPVSRQRGEVPLAERLANHAAKDLSGPLQWHPDGSEVLMVRRGGRELWAARVDARGSRRLWRDDRRAVVGVWRDEDLILGVRDMEDARFGVLRLPSSGRASAQLLAQHDFDARSAPGFSAYDRAARRVYLAVENVRSPGRIFAVDTDTGAVTETSTRQALPFEVDAQLIHWAGPRGEEVGRLLVAHNARRPAAVIVDVYPAYPGSGYVGASSLSRKTFSAMTMGEGLTMVLLARGYALYELRPAFAAGENAIEQIAAEVERAVQALSRGKRVDVGRMGVFGHSGGGYAVNGLITRMHDFKAGVSVSGISDLVSLYHSEAHANVAVAGLFEPFHVRPQAYIDNSPIHHLEAVRTPLLLVHGEEDENVPPVQSQLMFQGLHRLRKPVGLVMYPGVGHQFIDSIAVRDDRIRRIVGFYDQFLRN